MPTATVSRFLAAARTVVYIAGVGVTVLVAHRLATMPPPPPESDGFAHGMVAIIGGGISLGSLVLGTLAITLPTLMGWDDPLGFNRWQRLALKGAVALMGVGLVVAVVAGLQGVVLWLASVAVAAGVAGVMLLWRAGETVAGWLTRTDDAGWG